MSKVSMKEYREKGLAQLRKQGPVSCEKREQQALAQMKAVPQKKSNPQK